MDKTFTVTTDGWPKVNAILKQLGAKAPQALGAEFYEEAENLIGNAKEQTPHLTGNLKASGIVLPPVMKSGGPMIEAGFGGPAGTGNQQGGSNWKDAGYALIVHENLEAHHPVGNAEYLKRPLDAAKRGMEGRIAKGLKRRVKEFQ